MRLAVRAAAVNPTDIGLRQRGDATMPPPWVPGMDAAGTVESVGAGVERLAVGDEVMAAVSPRRPEGGAQSELLVVPEASVVPIPAGATLEQAATLPMNGLTALRGLELLDLEPGATLAVTGGAGLLASYVIPIAKLRGLRVLADAGPADEELVRGFGADVVLPRGDEFVEAALAEAPGGVDAVYDTALLRRGAFPAIRDRRGDRRGQGLGRRRCRERHHDPPGLGRDVLERTEWLQELSELAARGTLTLRVAATFPPERSPDAHRQLEAGGMRGRAVIVFDGGSNR